MPYLNEHINERVRVMCERLKGQSRRLVSKLDALEYVPSGYKTGNVPPSDGWQPLAEEQRLQGKDSHYWIRTRFTTPPAQEHQQLFLSVTTGKEGQWDATNPQGLLYLNGQMMQGLDTNHTEAYLEPDTTYDMALYFYLGMQNDAVPCRIRIETVDARIERLYYDLWVAYEAAQKMDPLGGEYLQVMGALEKAINCLDFREEYSDSYYAGIQAATDCFAREYYDKLCTTAGKPVVACVGHTHIDVEWQWTRYQTKEKIQRSFATAKALMDHYPEYRFMLSQPQLYQYLKEEAPEKYAELKQLVKEGRWEPEGAMYLEADCNLISGESFVRQILHGKRFFRQEFGVDNHILFLPDVFGYSAALPQILRKSGIRHFVTSKISWNDTNTVPVDTFLWQGIDGTEIFTNFITACDYKNIPDRGTTYVGYIKSSHVKGAWRRYAQKEHCNRTLMTFGFGDGGGGPTRDMLEQQRRLCKGLPDMPVTEMSGLLPHLDEARRQFDEACAQTKRVPRWVGELYLEFHRGTYTSIAKIKRQNRKSEFLLEKAEILSYTDSLFGGNYDADGLYRNWELVLHNQFHDIIPGSSIGEVYELTDKDYAAVEQYGNTLVQAKLAAIADNLQTAGGLLVYNPLGFAREGIVTVDGQTVETEEIPAFGWKVIAAAQAECGVTVDGRRAENRYYVLELDEAGRLTRLYDKEARREVFLSGKAGNALQVFEDMPWQYDNWELSDYYKQKMWSLDTPARIEPITDGSRAGFAVSRTYLKSTICQKIWLYTTNRRVDFETEIDWHEQHQVLKAAFPLDVHATEATFEIQFGHVKRPTHSNTSWEQAKFEVYGHKWVDVAENGYGVSLLNDSKFGHSIEGSTLSLTMVRAGTFPYDKADQGMHCFTYSLLPHSGDFREAGVVQEAYALNQPTMAIPAEAGNGRLPECFSLVTCDCPNIVLETVKKAEEDDGMIVRLYDAFDRRAHARLTVAPGFSRAVLCDLMENEVQELSFDGRTVALPVANFEIVTVKFCR